MSPREECGVLGISTPHGEGVAQLAFFGLFALQHRGQEAAGLAVSDGHRARVHKQPGLVSNVFTPENLDPLIGYHAIGHTRYSTTGASTERNIQPFMVETMHGPLALAHNGNVVNATRAARRTAGAGVRAHRDQRHRSDDPDARRSRRAHVGGRASERTLPAWKGAFSLVLLPVDRVLGGPRPVGLPATVGRPPAPGRALRVASETCALATLGCVDIDEVGSRARSSPSRAPSSTAGRRSPRRGSRPAARSSSSTSPAPTRTGRGATCISSASDSAPQLAAESPAGCRRGDPRARLVDPRAPSGTPGRAACRSTTG